MEAVLSTVEAAKKADTALKSDGSETPTPPLPKRPVWWVVGLVIILLVIAATFVPAVIGGLAQGQAEVHQPGITDFFPEAMIWGGTHFEFNRLTMARFIAAAVVAIIFMMVAAKAKLKPGRGQMLIEIVMDYLRKNIGIELLGTARGKRYAQILAFVFFSILAMNITGIVPGINIAASSVVSVPIVFAVFSYVVFIVAGIKSRGGATFFKEQLFPPGVPWPVYILLTPIEFVSTFIVRPATLAIRLLSNMIAGHVLLALTYFGTQMMMLAVMAMKPLMVATFAASIAITLFEIFVSVLQAYVFTILTAVYIKMSVESH